MNRREFVKLAPAFPAAAITGSLIVREDGKPPVELDVSVLKTQPGDVIVLTFGGSLPMAVVERIESYIEQRFEGCKAMVLCDGLKVEGVIRTA